MLKSAAVYLFGGVINSAIPFLMLPVLTRYLSTKEYGTLALFQVVLSFTTPVVGMNMQNNISRNFAKISQDRMAQLIGTMTCILGVTGFGLCSVSLLWAQLGLQTFGMPHWLFVLLPLTAALGMIFEFNLTVLRNQQRPMMFGTFVVSNTMLNLCLSLLLVVGLRFGWIGRAAGIICSAACFGIVGLVALRRQKLLVFKYDGVTARDVLRICLPLIPHAVGGTILMLSDRFFLDRMVSREIVGTYAVGYSFGSIVNLVVDSFNRAWSPWFYRRMVDATEKTKRMVVRYTYACIVGIFVLSFLIAVMSFWILPYMVSPKYHAASQFILYVALGYAFRGMYTMVFPYMVFVGRTAFLGVSTTFSALANIVLNYLLIRHNGAIGAAQATFFSFVFLFLVTWAYAAYICPMPWLRFAAGADVDVDVSSARDVVDGEV